MPSTSVGSLIWYSQFPGNQLIYVVLSVVEGGGNVCDRGGRAPCKAPVARSLHLPLRPTELARKRRCAPCGTNAFGKAVGLGGFMRPSARAQGRVLVRCAGFVKTLLTEATRSDIEANLLREVTTILLDMCTNEGARVLVPRLLVELPHQLKKLAGNLPNFPGAAASL